MDIIKYFNFQNYEILKIKHMQAGILMIQIVLKIDMNNQYLIY
jgi:hypothetical protein